MRKQLTIFLAALTAGSCSAPLTSQRPSEGNLGRQLASVQQNLTVEKDSIRVTVRYIGPHNMTEQQLAPKRLSKKDFEPILKDEYVNYAEGNNSDLLTLYNVYKEYQADQIRDYWGNPLFPEFILSPLFDDNAEARFTIFDVQIENTRSEKIRLNPFACAIVTDAKEQVPALTKDDLKTELDHYWARFSLTPFALNSTAFSREYFDRHIQTFQRMVMSSTTVYPGAKVRGLVFFPRLDRGVKSFTFILPDVSMTRENVLLRSVDFEIDFLKE